MEEKKQPTLTIDRAAFLLLRVKKAFKKKLQKKERDKISQLAASSCRIDQRASCAGLETTGRTGRKPPPLLRSRTLPAIVVPGVNILQAQLGNYNQDVQSPSHLGHRMSLTPKCHSARVWDDSSLDVRRKSAISRLCGSGNYGPERCPDGTVLLRVPAPHVVAARAYRVAGSGSGGLYKLSRLLNQSSKQPVMADDTNVPRRLSWEKRMNNNRLPRSSSIDSMVETIWAENYVEQITPPFIEKRASLRPDRPIALLSPTVGRRMKGQRGINGLSLSGRNDQQTIILKYSRVAKAT